MGIYITVNVICGIKKEFYESDKLINLVIKKDKVIKKFALAVTVSVTTS
jgi:hypothetical protein